MNIEWLQRVKARILAEPDRFDMDDWVQQAECGTACCIGGWAAVMRGYAKEVKDHGYPILESTPAGDAAVEEQDAAGVYEAALELTERQGERLFCDGRWPKRFQRAYLDAPSRSARARVAADRIDHFIATKGAR